MPSLETADGRALSYTKLGSGEPLVCHPGGPGIPVAIFDDLAGLDRDLELILLSPRGVDDSDPAATYELEDYAADLEELRAHLGLEAFDLFGHSAGGFMSMVYAATRPERVKRLVLCGSLPRFSDESREAFGRFLDERESDPQFAEAVAARRAREEDPPEDEAELARLALLGLPLLFGRYGEKERAFVQRAAESGGGYHLPALVYFNERVAPTFDLRPLLPWITAPTLVLTGELDPWGLGGAAELESLIPDARVVVLDQVGHMPWVEDPERFRSEVLSFLA
ncbi:MAG TPA: alpha/beta hydrolase [Gaiellaceae bacterium]|jgi:pimeloyl-ACP methyl ester carboxylesterase